MPGKDYIIHAREDIESILRFADSIGLVLLPQDLENDNVRPWKVDELRLFSRGTILLFRPEWVVDEIQLNPIKRGVDAGTYTVRAGINFPPISLYFSGDEDIAGVRRLGDGSVSFKREWLHDKAHEMRPTPPEVEQDYKQVCKHLLSKIVVKAGVHRYHVCKQAAELAARIPTRPPFDYIPWPPPDLNKKESSRKTKKIVG